MRLLIHPDAAINFNAKAELLFLSLVCNIRKFNHAERGFSPDIFPAATFTGADIIGDIELEESQGAEHGAKWFVHEGYFVGICGESYSRWKQLSSDMQRIQPLFKFVSAKSVSKMIFEWLRDKFKQLTSNVMTEYVVTKLEGEIREHELWFPVAFLHIQSEIRLGGVIFRSIKGEQINKWQQQWENQTTNPEGKQHIAELFLRKRKQMQGLAVAIYQVTAEQERAFEIAFEESNKAISLLRLFTPANMFPEDVSYCLPLGSEHVSSYDYLVFQEDKLITMPSGLWDKPRPWLLNDEYISVIRPTVDILSELLENGDRTEFQNKVLDAVLMYSKNAIAKEPSDKVVYILVALESILLKNENEPIMQNIGERMAIFVGKSVEERRAIIANVKSLYGLRSAFLHHGHSIRDLEVLRHFMHSSCLFFQNLVLHVNSFSSKQDFINKIEDVKLS
ncbi:MAG: hypothetical protein C0402_01530 [Thermodesulfovibrio sp.]|nr:hypothetical protein [Thermodesulfovibrio sp.]